MATSSTRRSAKPAGTKPAAAAAAVSEPSAPPAGTPAVETGTATPEAVTAAAPEAATQPPADAETPEQPPGRDEPGEPSAAPMAPPQPRAELPKPGSFSKFAAPNETGIVAAQEAANVRIIDAHTGRMPDDIDALFEPVIPHGHGSDVRVLARLVQVSTLGDLHESRQLVVGMGAVISQRRAWELRELLRDQAAAAAAASVD